MDARLGIESHNAVVGTAHDIQHAVGTEVQTQRHTEAARASRHRDAQECPRRAVVAQHLIPMVAGDVEMPVRPERHSRRPVQSARPGSHEGPDQHPGGRVLKYAIALLRGNVQIAIWPLDYFDMVVESVSKGCHGADEGSRLTLIDVDRIRPRPSGNIESIVKPGPIGIRSGHRNIQGHPH